MNNQMLTDMDPLNYDDSYEYPATGTYYPPVHPYNNTYHPDTNIPKTEANTSQVEPTNTVNDNTDTKCDLAEDVKPDIKKKKLKGKTSSYWNKKIFEKDFAFYGCAICNIAYTDLTELDNHVTVHENRVTSYDIRKQNLKKRKRLKKLKKKLKKEKIKEEFEVEIKPEDGYIGTEKAADVLQESDVKHGAVDSPMDKNVNVYKCFGCNKEFALSYYLRIHVRSHTDEKPYVCGVCGQSFITASKLGRHNKRIHLTVRHQCRICYRFFNRFELLVKHFDKMHADDKLEGEPYDYNTILPYLKELEEQMMIEKNKPKIEDPWDQSTPRETMEQVPMDVSKEENLDVEVHTKQEFIDTKPEPGICEDGSTTLFVPEPTESDIAIKQEAPDPVENNEFIVPEVNIEVSDLKVYLEIDDTPQDNGVGKHEVDEKHEIDDKHDIDDVDMDDHLGDDDDDADVVKEEGTSNSDSEYFPSDTCARRPASPGAAVPPGTACPVCNKTLSSKSYLRVHMRTHTGEKPFKCYICKRGFITASKMHRHVLTHDESWEDNHEGEIDENEKIDRKERINKAKADVLRKPKKSADKKVKSHKKWPHVCEYCHQRFLHTSTLQIHRKWHEGEALALRCQFCLETAQDDASLKEHEATHTGPKPYLCSLCGNSFKKKKTMLRHRQTQHDAEGPVTKPCVGRDQFVCDICSKKFNSQTRLRRHIISHSVAKYSLRYECPVCAHMFHTRYHVQMHLNTHMKEGLILEENRNAVLAMVLQNARKIPKSTEKNATQLTTQQTTEQTDVPVDERSRICNICGEIFQHFYYLEEHLKTHGSKIAVEDLDKEEEKKFTCQVCSKSFKLHYYLKLHSFTHTKEKPFICQQCGKGFITKGKLKRHLETHQGLKKYQCHICYKFFTRPSYLRIHVRTIHGTQDYNFRDYGLGVPIGAIGDS